MSIRINTKTFDVVEGEILLPKRSTQRFASPSSEHAGVQVLPSMATPFSLNLTRYNHANLLQAELDYGRNLVGNLVSLTFNGIVYEWIQYRLRFLVLDVQPSRTAVLPFASGSRNGVAFTYDPASVVVAVYTFQAVPL